MIESQWSPAVERALGFAKLDEEVSAIRTARLLLALIEDDESLPASLLQQHGLSITVARPLLESIQDFKDHTIKEIELTSLARNISRERDDYPNITSDCVLLAVLRIDISLTRQLEAIGLRFGALSSHLLPAPREIPFEELQLNEPTEQIRNARILDAAANRAREALRVLEDYARFAIDDHFLTEQCKQFRHELARLLELLPTPNLLTARETIRDVGTQLSTDRESIRTNLEHVAFVNAKRLQESLRSLEEFGKVHNPEMGRGLEQLRYRSYTIERAIIIGARARERLAGVHICVLLSADQCVADLEWTITEAAAGGVGMFQLREKNRDDRFILQRARTMRRWTKETQTLFIVNDRPDIARIVGADGVHLGQDDLPVKEARQILGPQGMIGVSTHSIAQLRQAVVDGADYVGIGPAFATQTKPGIAIAGLEYIRAAVAETGLPAFAIGGVTPHTIGEVVACGATRIAVSSAIAQATEPRHVAAILRDALNRIPDGLSADEHTGI